MTPSPTLSMARLALKALRRLRQTEAVSPRTAPAVSATAQTKVNPWFSVKAARNGCTWVALDSNQALFQPSMSVSSAPVRHLWLEVDGSEALSRSTHRSPTSPSTVDKRITATLPPKARASLKTDVCILLVRSPYSRNSIPKSTTQHKTLSQFAYPELSTFLTPTHPAYTSNSPSLRSEASKTMYQHVASHYTYLSCISHPQKQDSHFICSTFVLRRSEHP